MLCLFMIFMCCPPVHSAVVYSQVGDPAPDADVQGPGVQLPSQPCLQDTRLHAEGDGQQRGGVGQGRLSDSLWKVHHNFRLHVRSATYVNMKDVDLLYVRVGIYHGNEPLFPERQSRQVGLAALHCDELSNIY